MTTPNAVSNFMLDLASAPLASNWVVNPGFAISAPNGMANDAVFSVTAPQGVMGKKPIDPRPLFWLPANTSGAPSPLGRITSILGNPLWDGVSLTYAPTGGPNGQGCYASTVATGASGVWAWVLGIDFTQWSGWRAADPFGGNNGYYINDYGQRVYNYHRTLHTFPHLDGNQLGWNTKAGRGWTTNPIATSGAGEAPPDFYICTSNQRVAVEGVSGSPDFPSGGGANQGPATSAAVTAVENMTNLWYAEEMLWTTNSSSTAFDANFNWRVPACPVKGPFANGSMYNYPVVTYQTIQFQMLNAASAQVLAGNQRGTETRFYSLHYEIDGTAGAHTAAPAGAQVKYAEAYTDDSQCRGMATNSAIWGQETDFQPQIPKTWNSTASGDNGSFSAYNFPVGWYFYLVNAQGVATQVGQRIA